MLDPSPIIRLVIVDDHQGLRQILADALAEVPGFKVVGQASTGRETLELCQEVAPDIVLLDAMLPDANGLDLVRSLRRSSPRTRVVIYTGNTSPILVSRAVELGVSGFVEKSAAFPDLLKAIRSVASGTCYFSKAANQTMMRLRRSPFPPGACDRLTPRERMVLSAIAAGRRSKEIAADLGLSYGRFCALRLTHLIPRERLEWDYIVRLYTGFAYSDEIISALRGSPARRCLRGPPYSPANRRPES